MAAKGHSSINVIASEERINRISVELITAQQILEDLLQENDQNVHLYFLLAMAYHAGSNPEAALEYITEGQELMQRLQTPSDDPAAAAFQKLKVQYSPHRLSPRSRPLYISG